jgi:hypothetical protein
MKSTSSQKRARLKELSRDVQSGIYEMLKLADEILRDPSYVDDHGGEPALIDHLESVEFAHFGGNPSLLSMIRAYRHNKSRETWAEYRFNVRAMIELAKPAPEGSSAERINWKVLAKELEAKVAHLEAALTEQRNTAEEMRREAATAAREAAELRGALRAMKEATV